MLGYSASTLLLLSIIQGLTVYVNCGPLDAALSWARADRIQIDVNLPWLPCEYSII